MNLLYNLQFTSCRKLNLNVFVLNEKTIVTLIVESPSLLSSSSIVLETTLEQGSGCFEFGLSFDSRP